MKYDLKFTERENAVLRGLVGKRLESYRLNDTDGSSFEIFVLRLSETDVEVATREVSGTNDWFDETNTVEVNERPKRDSWSRIGKTEPDNGIPEGGFLDYDVGETVTGISVIVESFRKGNEIGEFVRGLVVDIGPESLVFDKGTYNWDCIWKVARSASSSLSLPHAVFHPVEEADFRSETRIERLA